jgi:tetratricopeptide (TPR) repeat protein
MRNRLAVPLAVAAITVAAFAPALGHGFLNWDDDKNLLQNPHIGSFAWESLRWMLTAVTMGHYHPLTWLSLALDHAVWGLDPRGYHLTNLLLHAANAVLFYGVALRVLERRLWGAALAALLFAVHPLRVESVAWISERRDLLSGLFYLLSVWAYLRAAQEGPRRKWLAVSLAAFAAGLLSKVIVVSLPAALVALDVCILRRRAWREKIPYLALAVAGAWAALAMQPAGVRGFAGHVTAEPGLRAGLSLYGLAFYVWKTLLPVGLSPQYVMAPEISPWNWRIWASGVAVAGVTVAALVRRWPAGLAVWAVYGVSLAPVLSLIRVDPQQYVADHHTYLATLGFALIGGAGLERRRAAGVAVAGVLAALSFRQTQVWRDSLTLWTHAVDASPYSATSHNNLGEALAAAGRTPEAVPHFRRAIELQPRHANAYYNLGQALQRQGQLPEAAAEFRRAIELEPGFAAAHNDLANCYAGLGRLDDAIEHYRAALRQQPGFADAHYNLGNVLQGRREFEPAIGHYREALRLNPSLADAHNNWGVALDALGRGPEAVGQYRKALAADPRHADAHNNLGMSLEAAGRRDEAVAHYREALRWNPRHPGAGANLARHLSR